MRARWLPSLCVQSGVWSAESIVTCATQRRIARSSWCRCSLRKYMSGQIMKWRESCVMMWLFYG